MERVEGNRDKFLCHMYNAELLRKMLLTAAHFVQAHVDEIKKTHLRDLLNDVKRCQSMAVYGAIYTY